MSFIKLHDNNQSAAYSHLIDESLTNSHLMVGGKSGAGLFTKTDLSGNISFNKTYTLAGETLSLKRGEETSNGDYIVYGSMSGSAANRNRNLVMRLSPTGTVQWAKSFHQDKTRINIDMVKSGNDNYYFISWYETSGFVDDVEIIQINGSGTVIAAKNLGAANDDDQVYGVAPWGNGGVVVFGGTGASGGAGSWDNFLCAFNSGLALQWSYLIGDSGYQQLRAVYPLSTTRFILAGEHTGSMHSFICDFDVNASSSPAAYYDFLSGEQENSVKNIAKTSSAYYLNIGAQGATAHCVAKFDLNLNLQWVKSFQLSGIEFMSWVKTTTSSSTDLVLAGRLIVGGDNTPMLIQTDSELDTCSTVTLTTPAKNNITFTKNNWNPQIIDRKVNVMVNNLNIQVANGTYTTTELCPQGVTLPLNNNPRFQSPYVYLQAAGSDQTDDSVRGFHLRWDFLRNLGNSHLPKGDLSGPSGVYPASTGFNRADDYVRIYKLPYQQNYEVTLDFNVAPNTLVESGASREWTYENLVPNNGASTPTTDIVIRFNDTQQYDTLRATYNPLTQPTLFIENYTGVIDARTVDKMFFYVEFTTSETGNPGNLRLETISRKDLLDPDTRYVTCRKVMDPGSVYSVTCDNMEYVRFDYSLIAPTKIKFITYEDFLTNTNAQPSWDLLDQYSLDDGNSDSNAEVFKRLEDTSKFAVHNTWRKFNEPSSGEFRVSVPNYENRWTMTEGLKDAVITYLTNSPTDPTATVTYPNDDVIDNDSEMDISYLDMLNFVSLDFHVARMLGLGTIDHDKDSSPNDQFVYLMEYVTEGTLDDGSTTALTTHFYMTLPVTVATHRLPPAPVQEDISYGIYSDNMTPNPTLLTDPDGYNPFGAARYIRLNREQFRIEMGFESFFQTSTEFCMCDETAPVCLGIEYADGTIAAGNAFKRPEINHDEDYSDPGGLYEVSPIPLGAENPLYIHEETTEGIHHYQLYSINWFSRISPVSNAKETDYTDFPPLNTMLPPSNLAVQLIQPESPLLFTTNQEQIDYSAQTGDATYVRITFDWNEIHNQAYQTATGVQFFWREAEPLIVQGEIDTGAGAVVEDPVTRTVEVKTTGYLNASVNQTVTPEITDPSRFIGARMAIDGQLFLVEAIVNTGVDPKIRLKQIRETATLDVNNDNNFSTAEIFISPQEGQRFSLTENLDNPSAWTEQLAGEVDLPALSTHSETVTYDDGTTKTFEIGGLIGSGTVTDIPDPDPNITSLIPTGGPSQVPTGVYTVLYDTALLPAYTNSDPNIVVNYQGGSVRLHDIDGAVKKLPVWNIETQGSVTKLTVFDPTFGLETDANGDYVLTGSDFTPVAGYVPLQTGSVSFINFHPSYRCYVKEGTSMNEGSTLPAAGAGTKNTFIAARSTDHSDTLNPLESFMAAPAVLMGREIVVPVPPGIPTGPMFATRPNFYGKATYTFDVEVDNPFALIFFRANDDTLLDQLYTATTKDQIKTQLAALTSPDADFFQDRWNDLVNLNYDTGTNTNREYTSGGFRFPMPDNDQYLLPHSDPSVQENPFASSFTYADSFTYTDPLLGSVSIPMLDIVKDAIDGAFLPLTETPPLYKQLQDTEFATSGKKPVLRNPQTGDRYLPADAEYDPWPMAFRYEKDVPGTGGVILQDGDSGYGNSSNTRYVRFTDYTLDGASKNIYFYFGVEMGSNMAVSDRSPVTGPIQLVNSAPAKSPGIKKVTSHLRSLLKETPTQIQFELNPYLETENIKQFEVYRATTAEDALSVRSMKLAKTINVGDTVKDDFSDLTFPPYGEPLFYRIVALREIVNEQLQTELVPSEPSNVALTNIVDNIYPDAPEISFTSDTPTGSPMEISGVTLSFDATAHNATYYVYKQFESGNWELIDTLTPDDHNNANNITVDLATTALGSNTLMKEDDDLNPIYQRFRVDVENSSGLLNIEQKELTI